ncbi:MAG: hypothetical protein H6912_03135 [Kordiimonadaceae bacterium]|nr:hypothetical protein [Kordiimonadaceae bacterium]
MKQYLAIYTGSREAREKSGWDQMDPEKRKVLEKSGIEAWHGWMNKNQQSIVFHGGPLGKTKSISRNGVSDVVNNLAGYIVINAESYEDAAEKFLDHPHFSIFPGDAVEIMECLPVPGM